MNRTKRAIFLSLLVGSGLVLSIIESFIPIPFIAPGAKLGLANIVALITVVLYGLKAGLLVSFLRTIILALSTGNVTALMYSLPAAVISTLVMFLVYKTLSKHFSLIGVSILGAIAHNISQITVATIVMENIMIYSYLPVMILVSLFTGYFVGLSSIFLFNNLKNNMANAIM
ncbi:Gx transporter family protein [Clostridiisalibacter paucivorans]|uniref:Gx transporter family protein n=1 Tax=Clostridiisalibacter paucivorans TaxID=408753 RepID=UPI00047EBA6C|nr:Gx transporter family protein [Clostridiisalibacter paucivorans]